MAVRMQALGEFRMLDRPLRPEMSTQVPSPGMAPLLTAFNPMATFTTFCGTSAFELSGQFVQSWLHFLGARWLQDLRFPQQLAACQTADDVSVAVSEFWQQTYRDYSTEFHRLADLSWKTMSTAFVCPSACTSEAGEACCGKCSSQNQSGTT